MKAKLFALILCCTLLICAVPVYAEEYYVTSDPTTYSSASTMTATEDVIGSGLSIKIPASFDLVYLEQEQIFYCDSEIVISGIMPEGKYLTVATDDTIVYRSQSDDSVTVVGSVDFGTAGVVQCYKADLQDRNSCIQPLKIRVDRRNIVIPGTYVTNVSFSTNLVDVEADAFGTNAGLTEGD